MEWLFSSSAQNNQPADPAVTIDKLCDRVNNATLLEDRRSAVQGLRGLSRDWQLLVGTKGMSAFIKVLKNDRMDVEITKLTLETLNILCTKKPGIDDENLGGMLTEIFVKDLQNVTLLLDILAEVDFYVRFNCLTFLSTILVNVGSALHEGILTSPLGVSRLIDLLDDRREVIRNEGLLFLIALTENHSDIQKIVAFENAFERLFSIILEEGSIDGGIVVQDCLQLMHNLLRYNASNQSLFRETSCIKQIKRLLFTKIEEGDKLIELPWSYPGNDWTDQKILNCQFTLTLMRILLMGSNQNTKTNQNMLGQLDAVSIIYGVAMEPTVPESLRVEGFFTVGDLIRYNVGNREKLSQCGVVSSIPVNPATSGLPNQKPPADKEAESILSLVSLILEKSSFKLRSAASFCFRCYVEDNNEAQIQIAHSINPKTSQVIGSKLLNGLLNTSASKKDQYYVWHSCSMVGQILSDNAASKEILLKIVFNEHGEEISLLQKISFALLSAHTEKMDWLVLSSYLGLLCTWLFNSAESVKEFLSEGSNMQFIVELINHNAVDQVVQGLAAFLYGVVFQFNDDSEPVFSKQSLLDLLNNRIGVDVLTSRVQRMKESKAYSLNDENGYEGDEFAIDIPFLMFLKENVDPIIKSLTSPKRKPQAVEEKKLSAQLEEYKQKVEHLLHEVSSKDSTIQNLTNEVEKLRTQINNQPATTQNDANQKSNAELQAIITEQSEALQSMETDQEDLLLCLADQELEILELKRRLEKYGETFEDDSEDQ